MNEVKSNSWQRRTILFLISQCITLFGSTLVQMAVVWYATMETASGAWVASFTVCSYLPQFLISFSGGVWADRYSRKLLIAGADALTALATLAMLLTIPHITSQPLFLGGLLLMSAIRSLGAGIQTPAVNAVIPQLVPEKHLMHYNGINAAMQSAVQFAAPAAAGAIFAVSTLDTVLMIDIVTAILGISLLSCLTIPSHESPSRHSSFIQDMKAGIGYAFSHRPIGKLLILYGLFTFLCVPAGFLAGLFVRRSFGDTYWYLTAVEVIGFGGMILGGILMSLKNDCNDKTRLLSLGLFAFGAFAAGMGLTKHFIPYLILMFFYGIALTAVQTSITTLVQKHTQPAMQGRVFGLLGTMYSGFLPLGMAVFGPLADCIPLSWIMVGSGGALILTGLYSKLL